MDIDSRFSIEHDLRTLETIKNPIIEAQLPIIDTLRGRIAEVLSNDPAIIEKLDRIEQESVKRALDYYLSYFQAEIDSPNDKSMLNHFISYPDRYPIDKIKKLLERAKRLNIDNTENYENRFKSDCERLITKSLEQMLKAYGWKVDSYDQNYGSVTWDDIQKIPAEIDSNIEYRMKIIRQVVPNVELSDPLLREIADLKERVRKTSKK